MIAIFTQIFPFFAVIALGYVAAKRAFFAQSAADAITKFVFYFALPAMLFRFASNLKISEIFDGEFVLAYWLAGMAVYIPVFLIGWKRNQDASVGAIEAQCAVFGNSGFLAIPMMLGLFGERAIGALLLVLSVDMMFFGSLIIVMIAAAREGVSANIIRTALIALVKNPMVMAMYLGVLYSFLGLPHFVAIEGTLKILGDAATPCALFAIGASLAQKSAERLGVAVQLSFAKLILHPAMAAFFALMVFDIEPFAAGIMIGVAAMPTAGNIYIIANRYNVAPLRVSSTILVSTVLSTVTLTLALGWVSANLISLP